MDTTTESAVAPQPRLVKLASDGRGYVPLLQGPPASAGMRSGYLSLPPGASVGRHTTGRHEEVLVVLAGSGRMFLAGHEPLALSAPCAAYCPPETEHDVTNTGHEMLRYVYVVAPVTDEGHPATTRRSS